MNPLDRLGNEPDPELSRSKYQVNAWAYDFCSTAAQWLRYVATAQLVRGPGETVLDAGCGTGLNFAPIVAAIGPTGQLLGVDPSPDMLATARKRVEQHGWHNVSLVEACIEQAPLPESIDAVLFSLVHDVMRSPVALKHVLSNVKPGGRVVAVGAKLVPWWCWWAPALNQVVMEVNRPYITSAEGLDRPWSHLATLVPDLSVQVDPWNATYYAVGTNPGTDG